MFVLSCWHTQPLIRAANRDQALKLAATLAEDQIPSICREYAQQLEVKGPFSVPVNLLKPEINRVCNAGEYQEALKMYQQSLDWKEKKAPALGKAQAVASPLTPEHVKSVLLLSFACSVLF